MTESASPPPVAKPDHVQSIASMTLVSGIINLVWGIGLAIVVGIPWVVTTLGIGILCSPIFFLPTALGIFEIIAGAKLNGNPPRKFKVQTFAILEIIDVVFGNIFALIFGILNLTYYNEPGTKAYIDSLPS